MKANSSRFIVLDGVTGSGKSTILKTIRSWMQENGYSTFDLLEWTNEHRDPPTLEDVASYDVLFTFEPTKQWIGRAIRYEMSQTESPYSGTELAQAFSLDRLTQYKRLIVPALEAGKIVIQDRSVTTSIVYQPIMPGGPELEDLLNLPGNAFAIAHAPDDIILTEIHAETLRERFNRDDDSKGVFEDIEFMKKANERFQSDWFKDLFQKKGTSFHSIDTSESMDTMNNNAIKLISTLLNE